VLSRRLRTRGLGRAPPGAGPLTGPDPREAFARTRTAVGPRYRLDRIVASSVERVLFDAFDEGLKRRVSLRVNVFSDDSTRGWFMREAEALGKVDHPAILHIYDAGVTGDIAFRVSNWIDGEGLQHAVARGPRVIPTVLALARDLLSAVEHAHLHGIIVRRISPVSVLVSAGGRGTVSDLRFCNYVLPAIPPGTVTSQLMFMAPESDPACFPPTFIQAAHAPGITRSLVKLASAIVMVAISGSCMVVERTSRRLAQANPKPPMILRVRLMPPILGAM